MIENVELGLKVAENEDEKFWTDVKDNTLADIDRLKKLLKFQESIKGMAEEKLAELEVQLK